MLLWLFIRKIYNLSRKFHKQINVEKSNIVIMEKNPLSVQTSKSHYASPLQPHPEVTPCPWWFWNSTEPSHQHQADELQKAKGVIKLYPTALGCESGHPEPKSHASLYPNSNEAHFLVVFVFMCSYLISPTTGFYTCYRLLSKVSGGFWPLVAGDYTPALSSSEL